MNEKVNDLFKSKINLIYFYEKNEPFYEFTNFYESKFYDQDGIEWKTSEHYFQSQKFDSKRKEEVRNLSTPRECFTYAKNNSQYVRNDWHDSLKPYKIAAMGKALF